MSSADEVPPRIEAENAPAAPPHAAVTTEPAKVVTPAAARAAKARRLKSLTIFAVVVWSALVFLAWSQPWFTLTAQGRAGDTLSVTVQGAVAAPALSALALAGLALAAALAIAGSIVRVVLGILEVVLGGSILASSIAAVSNPVLAGQSAVTTATGVAGSSSIQAIATTAGSALWPYLAIAAGALMVLTGILIVISVRRWPVSGRKYQPVQFAAADGRTVGSPAELFESDSDADDEATTAVDDGHGHGDSDPADAHTAGEAQPTADAGSGEDASAAAGADALPVAAADDDSANTAAVDSWDRLSRGQDPTA
ncbi:Trp biosynthesis-associated membrane protein [Subtercola lobariae]|uniref:Trp biosynthesis-associated membrane protein n=1 Tax=Subtercola lobariae TaxID=1588641 RepID=UPI001E2A201B|nr:Trp biosynthesis-associated membrane protein [Subtercola lobariae]